MKKVIMLPLSKQPQFAYAGEISSFSGQLQIISEQYANHGTRMSRGAAVANHLYIIDTEAEIVEGNWCISRGFGLVHVKGGWNNTLKIADKIVATTNPELGLPLINKEFIQLFVEKQGKIDEVDIEFKESFEGCECMSGPCPCEPTIKAIVTPKESDDVESAAKQAIAGNDILAIDMRIGFKLGVQWQKERSYSRSEVIGLMKDYRANNYDALEDFIKTVLTK